MLMEKCTDSYHLELQWIGNALLGSILIILGSFVRIPLYSVPFTLQTLAIFVLGLTQSPKQALASTVCYLLWGSMGLPVFGGTVNLFWMTGKSGGYLVAFPVAAFLIAWLRDKLPPLMTLICGQAVIFTLGWIWLAYYFGPKIAFLQGVVIFIPSAGLKMILALTFRRRQ